MRKVLCVLNFQVALVHYLPFLKFQVVGMLEIHNVYDLSVLLQSNQNFMQNTTVYFMM